MQYLPDGPSFYQVLPFGALYVWRNSDDLRRRFRGTFSGPVNDLTYNAGSHSSSGWELRMTLNTRSFRSADQNMSKGKSFVTSKWNGVTSSAGSIAYRRLLDPGHQDNALELSLTYEPGYRWFKARARRRRSHRPRRHL